MVLLPAQPIPVLSCAALLVENRHICSYVALGRPGGIWGVLAAEGPPVAPLQSMGQEVAFPHGDLE